MMRRERLDQFIVFFHRTYIRHVYMVKRLDFAKLRCGVRRVDSSPRTLISLGISKLLNAPMIKRSYHPRRKLDSLYSVSLWGEVDKLDRRLVVKLFTSSGGWIATMEEMVADEYTTSFVSDEPLVSFTVLTRDSEIVTWVKQQKRGKLSTENYSFYILGPEKSFEAFRIEGARASLGDDFNVIRLSGEVKDPVLAENEWFCRVLQCFSVMIAYRGAIRDKINKGIKLWKKEEKLPKQHRYEISLLANPRKLTLKLDELEDV